MLAADVDKAFFHPLRKIPEGDIGLRRRSSVVEGVSEHHQFLCGRIEIQFLQHTAECLRLTVDVR